MDFWGVEVKKGLTEIIKVPSGTALHLTLACLGPNTKLDERVFLECEVDHSRVILCCLTAGKVDNVTLKHVFASHHASVTLSVLGGNLDSNASIFVTGYLNIEEDPGELLEHYEDDEEIPYSSDEYSIAGSDYYDDDNVEGEYYDDEDEGEFYDDEEYDEDDYDDYDEEGEYYDDDDDEEEDEEDDGYHYRPPPLGYTPRYPPPHRVYFDTGRGRARVQEIHTDEDSDVAPPLIPATPTAPAAKPPASAEKKTQPSPKPATEVKKQKKPEKKEESKHKKHQHQHKHKHGEKKHGEKKHGEKKHGEKHKHHHGKSESSKKGKKQKKHPEQPPSKKRKHSS